MADRISTQTIREEAGMATFNLDTVVHSLHTEGGWKKHKLAQLVKELEEEGLIRNEAGKKLVDNLDKIIEKFQRVHNGNDED